MEYWPCWNHIPAVSSWQYVLCHSSRGQRVPVSHSDSLLDLPVWRSHLHISPETLPLFSYLFRLWQLLLFSVHFDDGVAAAMKHSVNFSFFSAFFYHCWLCCSLLLHSAAAWDVQFAPPCVLRSIAASSLVCTHAVQPSTLKRIHVCSLYTASNWLTVFHAEQGRGDIFLCGMLWLEIKM